MKLLRRAIGPLFFLAMLMIVPFGANPYYVFIATIMLIHMILAVGLNILIGYAGQLAFANAAIFGIGAYGAGLLQKHLDVPFWIGAPAGALLAMAVGTLLALPALRLAGIYLALATIAFAQCTIWVMMHWISLTYGASGFTIRAIDFSPLPVSSEHGMFYLTWACCVILVWLARNIVRSRIGRAFVALRDHQIAAQSLGIDLLRYKALAFAISAFYAGVAGTLYAGTLAFIGPESFGLHEMVLQLASVVIGGTASIAGSVLGGMLIVLIQEIAKAVHVSIEVVFGALLALFVLLKPSGLIDLVRLAFPNYREKLHLEVNEATSDKPASAAQ